MIGASLLWVGWFGFNAGSNLEANGTTALAFVNTMVATAAATLSWMFVEWLVKGKPSLLGLITGAVAGLVAVTPASGYAGPIGAIVLGLAVSPICFFFVDFVKKMAGYDDALDVFGVHCIGGIIGALATGILVSPDLGGVGITDYTNLETFAGTYDMMAQMKAQGSRHRDSSSGPASVRRSSTSSSTSSSDCGRRPIKSAKASTSPITASALTTTKFSLLTRCEAAPTGAVSFVSWRSANPLKKERASLLPKGEGGPAKPGRMRGGTFRRIVFAGDARDPATDERRPRYPNPSPGRLRRPPSPTGERVCARVALVIAPMQHAPVSR